MAVVLVASPCQINFKSGKPQNKLSLHRTFFCTNCLSKDDNKDDPGVKTAISFLRFYKREISPWLPGSCRFVPTCSEYSIQAYQKYGVTKGTVLTACRLLRCNPLGPSGFDPPRWFGEK